MNETIRTQGSCDFKNSGSLWSLGTVYSGPLGQVLGVHSRYNTHTHTHTESDSLPFGHRNLGIPTRFGHLDAFSWNIDSWVSDAKRHECLEIIHVIWQSYESISGPVPMGVSWGVTPDVFSEQTYYQFSDNLLVSFLLLIDSVSYLISFQFIFFFFSDQVTPELSFCFFFFFFLVCFVFLWKRQDEEKDIRIRVYLILGWRKRLPPEGWNAQKDSSGDTGTFLETKKIECSWELPNKIFYASCYFNFTYMTSEVSQYSSF